jgi:hypothetical protein
MPDAPDKLRYEFDLQVALGKALLGRAGELVDLSSERWCEAEITRLKARFVALNPAEATDLLHSSLAIARRQNAQFWELRAASSIAEHGSRDGNAAAARETLASVYGRLSEGHDTPDLSRAKALLEG